MTTLPASPASQALPERIEPFFFDGPQGRLYACHHPPPPATAPRGAVLLCAPAGHESARSHRALRQLASQLARAGFDAMRFDSYGCGDSDGQSEHAGPAGMQRDIGAAIDELRRRSAAGAVVLLGLRLGATLALRAAAGRTDVQALVLWRPLFDGRQMLAEWQAAQREFLRCFGHAQPDHIDEVLGLPLGPALAREIEAVRALAAGVNVAHALLCPAAEGGAAGEAAPAAALAAALRARGTEVEVRALDHAPIWRQQDLDPMVPFQALREIVGWVAARGAAG